MGDCPWAALNTQLSGSEGQSLLLRPSRVQPGAPGSQAQPPAAQPREPQPAPLPASPARPPAPLYENLMPGNDSLG